MLVRSDAAVSSDCGGVYWLCVDTPQRPCDCPLAASDTCFHTGDMFRGGGSGGVKFRPGRNAGNRRCWLADGGLSEARRCAALAVLASAGHAQLPAHKADLLSADLGASNETGSR